MNPSKLITNADQAAESAGAKHTALPWEYAKTGGLDDRFDIYQADTGWTIARTVNNAHVDCRDANVRLIVTAVNEHDALVAENAALRQAMADIVAACECPEKVFGGKYAVLERIISVGRASLAYRAALAERGQS